MSPAAMFLSSFSPASGAPARAPDAEGEYVSGYKLGPVIAYGGFSSIRCASSSSGGTVAVKIVRRSDIAKQQDPALARKRLDHEASVWLSLSHEHILPLFSAVHTSYADFFVTLYCPAGSLFDIMKRDGHPALPQDDVGMMFRQVVRGLRYMHEVARLVHRDVKLENVLVDEMGVCRIGDFGMSRNIGELDADDEDLLEMRRRMDDDQLRTQSPCGEHRTTFAQAKRQTKVGLPVHLSMIRHHSGPRHRTSTPVGNSSPAARPAHVFQTGSLPYAAPELLMPQFSTPARVDPAQDIWALGVMLYAMLTGRLPFVDTFDPRLQMKILHGKFSTYTFISRKANIVE
jgi:serine/threonine protein kinase